MTDVVEALAFRFNQKGFGVYRNSYVYVEPEIGILIDFMSAEPSRVIVLTTYDGPEADSLLPYDMPRIQIMVRDDNPLTSRARATAIYDDLQGLGPVTIQTVRINLMTCVGSGPVYAGQDNNKRHLHVVNFEATVFNPNRRGPA